MQSRTIKIPLSQILRRSNSRPAGYFEDVTSRGYVIGDVLEIDSSSLDALRKKYEAPIKKEKWPLAFRMISNLRQPQDSGVGDTIARTIGPVGGDAFKAWFKSLTGKSCGCAERQEQLNKTYPYVDAHL